MKKQRYIIQHMLDWLKTVIFEKGKLIYWINIPSFQKSMKRIKNRKKNKNIRIGFVLRKAEDWPVIQSVYQKVLDDDNLEPIILLVPEMNYSYYIKLRDIQWDKIYEFGENVIHDNVLRTYDPMTNLWQDPAKMNLDYIFVTCPYETYLPRLYRASNLRKYSQVCYIPYGFPLFDDNRVLYNMHFIRNVSMIFCEQSSSKIYINKQLSATINSNNQKVFLCGYPKFDLIEQNVGRESTIWPRKKNDSITRILWTPRWTTDPKLGGSHFFAYKDQIIEWAKRDTSIDLVFRPHPLALEHYISTGQMTEKEQEEYLNLYYQCSNANIDRTSYYFNTFYSSDCLITDVSSIIVEYMFTGKPIIYCYSDNETELTVPELRDCLYCVDSFEKIKEVVGQIRRGDDSKKEMRQNLICKIKPFSSAAEEILQKIKQDYQK